MKFISVVLVVAISLSITACRINPDPQPSISTLTENHLLSLPEISLPSDDNISSKEDLQYTNSEEYRFASEIYHGYAEEIVRYVNEIMETLRDGTFQEIKNHHPNYPDDFPDKAILPTIDNIDDISICWRATKPTEDVNVTRDGAVYVVVYIDKTHILLLSPGKFGTVDNKIAIGFSDSYFVDVIRTGNDNIKSFLFSEESADMDGIMGSSIK